MDASFLIDLNPMTDIPQVRRKYRCQSWSRIGFDIAGNNRHKNDWLRKYYVSKNMYYFSLQDHEFIPTRQKTITASRPAADPGKFTKVPSNPLLISAQRQIMQAEEIRRRKESRERAEKAAAAAGLTTNTLCPV